MMQKGKARNMFSGGNTSKGFYSRFDNIISPEEARRIFLIKGGPGTGKSTFMKNVSEIMTDRGYDVELMHCSSDSNSLDGIVVPELRAALIDGTAPHATDPKVPGAVDEIINLGEYWSEEALAGKRTEIMRINSEIKFFFQRAYRYLKAAYHIYEDSSALYGSAMNRAGLSSIAAEFTGILFDMLPIAERPGRRRCLYASAITPDGLVSYVDDLMTLDNIYVFEGFPGSGTDIVLERIKAAAVERGFDVEAFYCGFDPNKLEHLIIPELNTAFSTAGKYHSTDACAIKKVEFRELLDCSAISGLSPEPDYNGYEFDRLLDKAVEMISNAKMLHDELEACYIPHMDFEGIKKKQDEIVQRILGYA
jgi:hypothetical protein